MATVDLTKWNGFRDFLLPGLWSLKAKRDQRIYSADLGIDYARDELMLYVVHRLCTRKEMENRMFDGIVDRMKEALLVKAPDGKDHRITRRQLHWRGKQAAQAKPRRFR